MLEKQISKGILIVYWDLSEMYDRMTKGGKNLHISLCFIFL
jgi:uncharacterized membrane protein YwzB